MNKLATIVALPAALFLSGCFGPNPGLRIEQSPGLSAAATANAVTVLNDLPAKAQVLGEVEGSSCQNKVWDPKASEPAALDQLKLKAAALGANAVVNLTYANRGAGALTNNCWTLITATGTAVRQP